jgi:hypothetical protein
MFHEVGIFLRSLTKPEADLALRELAKIIAELRTAGLGHQLGKAKRATWSRHRRRGRIDEHAGALNARRLPESTQSLSALPKRLSPLLSARPKGRRSLVRMAGLEPARCYPLVPESRRQLMIST